MNQPVTEDLPVTAAESNNSLRHWPARLDLQFGGGSGRTRLLHCEHQGPLRVQRLFHPDDQVSEKILVDKILDQFQVLD